MASTDKTPPAERISERVGDLLAASEGRVRELQAEVEDALRGQDKLRGQLLKELAEVGGLQAEVVRLRQERDEAQLAAVTESPLVLELEGQVERLREALRLHHTNRSFALEQEDCEFCAVASPDKPPERVVRTTITDLDAFN